MEKIMTEDKESDSKKKFYSIIDTIQKTKCLEKKLELFFRCIPVIFWQPKTMKEILGILPTLFAFRTLNKNHGMKSFPRLDMSFQSSGVLKSIRFGSGVGSFFGILNGFLNKDKMKLSDLNISEKEIQNGLCELYEGKITSKNDYKSLIKSLIEYYIIGNVEELKKFCTSTTEETIGYVILDIIFDNLDILYKTKCMSESEIAKQIGIPEWLMDCIFENYMERYLKINNDDFTFLFSYTINNQEEKWLEKVIIKIVQKLEIEPLHLAEYFSILGDDKFDLDPENGGFIKMYYDDKKDIEEIDKKRYFWFYMKYIEDENHMKNCNKNQLGVLFLTLLGKGIIDEEIADCFMEFLVNLEPTEEQIKKAFITSFLSPKKDNLWLLGSDASYAFTESMRLFEVKFFESITFAVMNTMNYNIIEELLFPSLSGIFLLGNKYMLEDYLREEDKPKIGIILDNVNKIDDKQKLKVIVCLSGDKFKIINKETLVSKFNNCFILLFETYIHNSDKDFFELSYNIIKNADALGLTDEQVGYIYEVVLQKEDIDFFDLYNKKLTKDIFAKKFLFKKIKTTLMLHEEKKRGINRRLSPELKKKKTEMDQGKSPLADKKDKMNTENKCNIPNLFENITKHIRNKSK